MGCCESLESSLVRFKLKSCCCIASVKLGLNIVAYFNVLVSAVSLLSEGRFSPIAKEVQNLVVSEGSALHQLVNIANIFFNFLLVIAVNKKIPVLLRIFIYYCTASIAVKLIVLGPLIQASEDGGLKIIIVTVLSILFECYMMLLVRSVMVEINEEIAEQNGKVPTQIVFTPHSKDGNGHDKDASVEIIIPSPKQKEDIKKEEHGRLETVHELPNETATDVKQDAS
ncbi:unnamed protein product [Chilo suppressalis]|uniref:Uncharacterized protein n=1 Tax=Chilo suppressalis TaxID=168631 RepID=A0ABN8EAI1_CHISP|nr:unnamed protein product [Chilo suppressalis]